MGAGKVCVCLFVIFFNLHMIDGKPFFFSESFWCDVLCEDDDDYGNAVSTVSTTTDIWDDMFDICSDCPNTTRRPPRGQNQPVNVMIPPLQQGMNLTMTNVGGSWFMNMIPWGGAGANMATTASPATTRAATAGPAGAPAATTAAAPAATPAAAPAATTAAPAATTNAAAATTAAAGATTAKPTTKAG